MAAATWVFGHVTNHLTSLPNKPYDKSSLKAATYDWRMPPAFLEERDRYFSNLVRSIEKMYEENGERPVVLLGHSMGCKMGHYFPNWVVNNGPGCVDCPRICRDDPARDGEAWMRKYRRRQFNLKIFKCLGFTIRF